MPWLEPVGGGEPQYVPDESLSKALSSGLYRAPDAGTAATVVDPVTGLAMGTTVGDLERVQTGTGFDLETEQARLGRERGARLEEEHGGILGQGVTALEHGLDAATFGAFGAISEGVLGTEYTSDRRERTEVNEEGALVGDIGGAVLPGLVSGGAGTAGALARATPAGLAARAAEKVAEAGAKRGLVAGTALSAAGYGVEGALFNAGHVLSETILHDKELSAEALVAGAEEGMFWGGIGGAGGSLLSRGTKAAKNKVDDLFTKSADEKTLTAQLKQAEKDFAREQRVADRIRVQNERALNQRALEELKTKGKLTLVETRGKTAAEIEELRAAKRIEAKGFEGEQKLKLEEYRLSGKKELAELGNDARLQLEETRGATRLAVADKGLEKAMAQAEAKAAIARAKVEEVSEKLAIQQERTARASLVMDKRLELADKYGGHWRAVNESKETQRALTLQAADITADARTRVGLAEALTKSGRQDAGMLIEEMIPARMRTPKAVEAARGDAMMSVARLQSTTDDLIRRADEVMMLNPAAAEDLRGLREVAAEASPAVTAWSAKASTGADDFAEGFTTVRQAEQAQHDLAQAMSPYLDDVGQQQLAQVTKGMDDAVGKSEDIIADGVAKNVEAATKAERDVGGAAGMLDLAMMAGGLPNADDIPVIGPVLGAYLKFRAASGALGKLGIRVPGGVAKIAKLGAGVQNKASEVVNAIVQRAPQAAKLVEKSSVGLTTVMSRPLWEPLEDEKPARPQGTKPASKPRQQYQKRVEELERAVADVDGTRRRIIESIPAPPALAGAIADAKIRKLEYLAGEAPKDPRPITIRRTPYTPNPVELQRFSEKVYATERPVDAIKQVFDGVLSPAAAEAVKAVFPRLFQSMQDELVERLSEAVEPPAWEKLVRAALIFDLPLDPSVVPSYSAARQAEYEEQQQQQAPTPTGGGPQLALSKLEESGPLRRAMR